MKKSIVIVLGLASLAACTKSSVSYEQTDQISFAPIASVNKTKAAIDGTTFPTANSMGVYAYYKSGVAATSDNTQFSDPDTYLSNAKFSNKTASALWAGDPNPYYWPKTGSLIFAAYSPETPALTHTFSVTETEGEDGAKKQTLSISLKSITMCSHQIWTRLLTCFGVPLPLSLTIKLLLLPAFL